MVAAVSLRALIGSKPLPSARAHGGTSPQRTVRTRREPSSPATIAIGSVGQTLKRCSVSGTGPSPATPKRSVIVLPMFVVIV